MAGNTNFQSMLGSSVSWQLEWLFCWTTRAFRSNFWTLRQPLAI